MRPLQRSRNLNIPAISPNQTRFGVIRYQLMVIGFFNFYIRKQGVPFRITNNL